MRNTLKIKYLLLLIIGFFQNFQPVFGQSTADSLRAIAEIDTLLARARTAQHSRKLDLALEIATTALTKSDSIFGKSHPAYASCLGAKGRVLFHQRKFAEAEPIFVETLALREQILGSENIACAQTLDDLASIYVRTKRPAQAIEKLHRAKMILEKANATGTMLYPTVLTNFSFVLINSGQYEEGEKILLLQKSTLEKLGKIENQDYASCLSNLGAVFYYLGQKPNSRAHFEQAVGVFRKINMGKDNRVVTLLSNLGLMYSEISDFEKAKSNYLEAAKILEETIGKSSPEYAHLMLNTGGTYFHLKDWTQAETAFFESKSAFESIGQANGDLYWRVLRSIGKTKFHRNQRDAEALGFYQKALAGRAAEFGEEDFFGFEVKLEMATVFEYLGRAAEADSIFCQAADLEKRLLNRATAHFSQQELAQNELLQPLLHNWLGTAANIRGLKNSDLISTFYDALLFRKGYFLQSSQIAQQLISAAAPAEQQVFSDWKNCQKQLSDLYAQPKSARKNVDSLETRANFLEKNLIQNLKGFADARREIRWQDVQKSLKTNEIAIEFLDFEDPRPEANHARFYAALILLPGKASPEFVPLFEEKDLLKLTSRSKSWLQDFTEKLYAHRQPDGSKSLFQLLWQPLEKHFSGGEKIHFSASGLLHRLNLEAIEMPDGKVLGEKFEFAALGSTRQLALENRDSKNEKLTAAIFGGVQFDADSASILRANSDLVSRSREGSTRSFDFSEADSTLRGSVWKYLPATEREAQSIDGQLLGAGFQSKRWTGPSASEEAFKNVATAKNSPTVLHVATHGFFFPDNTPQPPKGGAASSSGEAIFKVSENPMMRSGLVLAGANHAWKTGQPLRPTMDDGIVTALEISQLDLTRTDLVVLSACETGLGDLAGNEGVLGLQRAFKLAGARFLVMSLWKVDDEKTGEMMSLFYEKWLRGGLEIPGAFRAAQAEMRRKYANPFFWAGFVLVE